MNPKRIKERILLSSAIIYVIIILLCVGSILHIHIHKKNVTSRKQGIEESGSMTEILFLFINHAQNNFNLYLATKNEEHITHFIENINSLQNYMDSIKLIPLEMERVEILDKVNMLLNKRIKTVTELNILYDRYNSINNKLQLTAIEEQIAVLINDDYERSILISDLMIDFHKLTVDFANRGAYNDVRLVRWTYIIFIVGSVIFMLLVSTLIIFITRDVKKSHQIHLIIEEANRRTNEIFENQHRLLLSISHDVKTPANSILGYLDLWKHGHDISSKEIAVMKHSAKHILTLMENLLDYSCLNQGLMKLSQVDFNLYELCSDIIEMFTPLALEKRLSLDVNLTFDHSLQLNSDATKIKRIVINLLSNALKYTINGGVKFYASYKDENIFIEINDTGKGISSEKIDKIFDAFVRVEENNSLFSGSGLGLFVVKGMLDILKGDITLHSVVDKGTQIKVIIPAQKVSTPLPKITFNPKQILAIDDDLAFLLMIKKMILKLGHQVDICHTIEEFEEKLEQHPHYDLILTDADMITFSGIDIMQKVKDKGLTLPLYLMSGQSNFDYEEVIKLGFHGFLRKPVTINSLEQLLGGNKKVSTSHTISSLEELFQGDRDTINKVLKIFVESTTEHNNLLKQAVTEDNFTKAQQICHKMLPMFMQITGTSDAVNILTKINKYGKQQPEPILWKEEVLRLIELSQELVSELEKEKM